MNTDSLHSQLTSIVAKARIAQKQIAKYNQEDLYRLAKAVAWAVMEPQRNKELSKQAVADTALGNVEDKIIKNHRKTLGLLRDLLRVRTTGVINEMSDIGVTEIARPLGVVAAVTPSTNPIATPVNKIINALCCGNAIIISPSPKGCAVFAKLLNYIHTEFKKIDAPLDLVQAMPSPPSKEGTKLLMQMVDFVVVTGSQNNVREAYRSGTPAVGVGTGNVTTLIDESADIKDAATKISLSKSFDNATSCSCENNLICVASIYEQALSALQHAGGYLLNAQQQHILVDNLWQNGKLNTQLIAQDAVSLANRCGIKINADSKFLIAQCDDDMITQQHPLTKERMSPLLSLYKAKDYVSALAMIEKLLNIQGAGHSIGIHTQHDERAREMGHILPTCRVIVNQAHCFATGGAFNNGLPFSLSMGCGSWGENSIADNLHYKQYLNTTRIVRKIANDEPTLEEIFADYWQ